MTTQTFLELVGARNLADLPVLSTDGGQALVIICLPGKCEHVQRRGFEIGKGPQAYFMCSIVVQEARVAWAVHLLHITGERASACAFQDQGIGVLAAILPGPTA